MRKINRLGQYFGQTSDCPSGVRNDSGNCVDFSNDTGSQPSNCPSGVRDSSGNCVDFSNDVNTGSDTWTAADEAASVAAGGTPTPGAVTDNSSSSFLPGLTSAIFGSPATGRTPAQPGLLTSLMAPAVSIASMFGVRPTVAPGTTVVTTTSDSTNLILIVGAGMALFLFVVVLMKSGGSGRKKSKKRKNKR